MEGLGFSVLEVGLTTSETLCLAGGEAWIAKSHGDMHAVSLVGSCQDKDEGWFASQATALKVIALCSLILLAAQSTGQHVLHPQVWTGLSMHDGHDVGNIQHQMQRKHQNHRKHVVWG